MSFDGYRKPGSTTDKTPYTPASTESQDRETVDDVLAIANPFQPIPERHITEQIAKYLGIRTRRSPDGTSIAHYFPYYKLIHDQPILTGFKKRDLTKDKKTKFHFTSIGEVDKNVLLFGAVIHNALGKPELVSPVASPKLVIVEGEYDVGAALRAVQLHRDNPTLLPAITSLPLGTASAAISVGSDTNKKLLKQFPEWVIGFDNDSATADEKKKGIVKGTEATKMVVDLLGEDKVKIAEYPLNCDPCDMMQRELSRQLFWSFMKPKAYRPQGFIEYQDFREKAIKLPELGRSFPWPMFMKKTLGRRTGEGMYIGSGVKQGKSELLNKIIQHIIDTEEAPPCIFKLEETPDKTCQKIAGKIYKKQFNNPEKVRFPNGKDIWGNDIDPLDTSYFTQQELEDACDFVNDKVIYYNNYGSAKWDDLKEKIRYAVVRKGSRDVFIDPLTKLVEGMSASDANQELERISSEMASMAMDLGFFYCFFNHLKAPTHGAPHEFGGKVMSSQFTGSRAMMRNTFYMIGLERDKTPEAPEIIRNMSHLVILDDRQYGRTGKVRLFYDVETGDYREPSEAENEAYDSMMKQKEDAGSWEEM
jgi:hypothetical protein